MFLAIHNVSDFVILHGDTLEVVSPVILETARLMPCCAEALQLHRRYDVMRYSTEPPQFSACDFGRNLRQDLIQPLFRKLGAIYRVDSFGKIRKRSISVVGNPINYGSASRIRHSRNVFGNFRDSLWLSTQGQSGFIFQIETIHTDSTAAKSASECCFKPFTSFFTEPMKIWFLKNLRFARCGNVRWKR